MHVFVAMASGARGGGANHLLALLPALQRLHVEVTAWVGDDGPLAERLVAQGVPARAVSMMGGRADVRLGRRLMAHANASGADLVHVHGTRTGVLAAMGSAVSVTPLPRIYSAHGLAHRAGRHAVTRGLRLGAEWLACATAAAITSVSQADLGVLKALPGLGHKMAFHVPNVAFGAPLDHAPWPNSERRAAARTAYLLPQGVPLVGTVSRLVPQKNVAALADAVLRCQNVHLAVAGDGPKRAQLQLHPLAAQGRLHLLGAQDDVPRFLPALDVFALSSRWEGEPIALLEAMAHGLPWVATRTLGSEEICRASGSGTIVAQRDSQALAAALMGLLHDPARASAESSAGRRAMRARTPEVLAHRMLGIYRQVVP